MLQAAEHEFLTDGGPFIGGSKECTMADIHAIWIIKWLFQTLSLGKEPGFGKEDLPRVYRWIEALPLQAEAETKDMFLSVEDAHKSILSSDYGMPDIGVDEADPLELKAGEMVGVEANDAKPGTYPQVGKLVGLNSVKSVIELRNGLRVHFPKVGYVINRASESADEVIDGVH